MRYCFRKIIAINILSKLRKTLIFVEKYGILNVQLIFKGGASMREVMTVFGVVVAIGLSVMMLKCPEAKENLGKEHRKSLIIAIIPLIAFIVLVAYVMSHVGL